MQTQTTTHKDKQADKVISLTNKLWSAQHFSTLDVVGQLACKSKVNYLQLLVVRQHQVLRLHKQLTPLLIHSNVNVLHPCETSLCCIFCE